MKHILEFKEFLNEDYYTIGWYDDKTKAGIKDEKVFKLGKTKDYSGGIVFKDLSKISKYLKDNNLSKKDLHMYQLINTTEKDIYKASDGNYYLLKDKLIKNIK